VIASSRPLRFLALLVGAWVTMRAAQLWPVTHPVVAGIPALLETIVSRAEGRPTIDLIERVEPEQSLRSPEAARPRARRSARKFDVARPRAPATAPAPVRFLLAPAPVDGFAFIPLGRGPVGSPLLPAPATAAAPRLRASLWTIVRGGGAASPFSPQLGGSQAGMRLTYAIGDARRLALAGRVSTALGSRQREGAIGVEWQPTALPIHLIAEQRIGIEGVRGGPSIGVIAGVGPLPIAAGFRLGAYGQAGGIARDGDVEGYADGAARVARPVAAVGTASIDLGVGAWGGAQRGAARLDVGPTASASVPFGAKTVRVSVDWRQRVAGDARPGSGPALSIGTDF
jgi:hypothetical protein